MYGTIIKSVRAHQVYTNRGKPGVEVIVTTENGSEGRAMCTSGVSIGTHEVDFTFDGGTKFGGKGVTGLCEHICTLKVVLVPCRSMLPVSVVDLGIDLNMSTCKILVRSVAVYRQIVDTQNVGVSKYLVFDI